MLGRAAQIHRARLRAVIPFVAARYLEKSARIAQYRGVVPGQVRRGGVLAGGKQGHDGGVIAAMAVGTLDARPVDLRDQIVLAHRSEEHTSELQSLMRT